MRQYKIHVSGHIVFDVDIATPSSSLDFGCSDSVGIPLDSFHLGTSDAEWEVDDDGSDSFVRVEFRVRRLRAQSQLDSSALLCLLEELPYRVYSLLLPPDLVLRP